MAKTHGKSESPALTEMPSPSEKPTPTLDRIAIVVDPATGEILWNKMRESTRARLKTAFSDPKAVKELGLTKDPGSATIDDEKALLVLTALATTAIYNGLGSLLTLGVQYAGAPADLATMMQFTEKQKAEWQEPTMAVIQQYLPDALKSQHAAAIGLGVSVGLASLENYGRLRAAVDQRRSEKRS